MLYLDMRRRVNAYAIVTLRRWFDSRYVGGSQYWFSELSQYEADEVRSETGSVHCGTMPAAESVPRAWWLFGVTNLGTASAFSGDMHILALSCAEEHMERNMRMSH